MYSILILIFRIVWFVFLGTIKHTKSVVGIRLVRRSSSAWQPHPGRMQTHPPRRPFRTGGHCHLGPAAAACGSRPSRLALAGMDGGFLLRQVVQSPALRTLLCASGHSGFRRWRVTAARHVPLTSSCLAASVASPGYCPNQRNLAQEDEATPPQPNPPLHAQPRATPRAHRGLLPTHGGSF